MSTIPVARDFMAKSLVTLGPKTDIFSAIDILLRNRISGAPVIDEDKKLIGMLSEKDCLRVFASGAYHQGAGGIVSDYMSTKLTTVSPEDDLFKVAEVFLKNSFRRLPVMDNGVLVGQVSRRDVLEASHKIWTGAPAARPWTDSRYLTDEIKAALADRPGSTKHD
jgi:CBS domain-containing protein